MTDFNNFLSELPPPPKVPRPRGRTRDQIPTGKESLFVRNVEQLCSVAPPDEKGTQRTTPSRTQKFVNVNKLRMNATHLQKMALKKRNVTLKRSPKFVDMRMPAKTDVLCWWCKHSFTTRPVGCPYKINHKKKIYCTEGIFCSYSCASAYATDTNSARLRFSGSKLVHMRKHIDGVSSMTPLLASPHWCSLKAFGGHLSISEFRLKSNINVKSVPENIRVYSFGFNLFETSEVARTRPSVYDTLVDSNGGRGHNMPKSSFNKRRQHAIKRTKQIKRNFVKSVKTSKHKFGNVLTMIKRKQNKKKSYVRIKLS
jgi:hypothetical protein